jgi:hypothetical protein
VDEYDQPLGEGTPGFSLRQFRVLRRTPKGVWLQEQWMGHDTGDGPRFMLDSAVKRFASRGIDAAVIDWLARKNRQRRIYLARIGAIESAIQAIGTEAARWKRQEEIGRKKEG